jgi:CheY-like chemotaxis protein
VVPSVTVAPPTATLPDPIHPLALPQLTPNTPRTALSRGPASSGGTGARRAAKARAGFSTCLTLCVLGPHNRRKIPRPSGWRTLVPKTLLAVDDSATMRKVLEITFGGEDFRVVTADGGQRALAQLSEEPIAVVIDTSLEGEDAYALAREVRSRDGRAAIVIMASRYNPYDAAKGKAAGADDFIDKPFDTQSLIEKVKKAIGAREAGAGAQVAAAPAPVMHAPPVAPSPPPPQVAVPQYSHTPRAPAVAPPVRQAPPVQRTNTLSFEGGPSAPSGSPPVPPAVVPGVPPQASPISRTAPSGMPIMQRPGSAVPQRPGDAPTAVPQPAIHGAPSPVAAAVNGQLAGKLGDLGLSPAQVDAVLALSREVVERVVWEVVPQLAETIIKEEIARLTKE